MGKLCYCCMRLAVENGVCQNCGQPELAPNSNGNALPLGTRLCHGRLTVGKKLGNGGFGITYIAFDHKNQCRVALKEFMPSYMADRSGLQIVPHQGQMDAYVRARNSFLKEAGALRELREHPNIVHFSFAFAENNTAYYTMEMLEGESLLNYLKREKKISGENAFRILAPIMDAVEYAHRKHILHRDISPDNIMLCRNARGGTVVKLIDFGAAHVAIQGYSASYPGVKKNGFSPIEQNWTGDSQGPWTDVYALCATFYSAVIGGMPVAADQRANGGTDPLLPPSKRGGNISPALEAVLMRGLAVDPKARIRSVAQLKAEMQSALQQDANSEKRTVPVVNVNESAIPKRPVGRRVGAWLIERALLLLTTVIAVFNIGPNRLVRSLYLLFGNGLQKIILAVFGAFALLDLILLLSAGATLGQLLCGIRVRGDDGKSKPGFGSALLYALLYNTVIQTICGIVWLASGKNIGPLERLLALTVQRKGNQQAISQSIELHGESSGSHGNGISQSHSGRQPVVRPETPTPTPVTPKPPALTPAAATATLTCIRASSEFAELIGKRWVIHSGDSLGHNAEKAKYVLKDHSISGKHCTFELRNNRWIIKDEDSKNGTYLRGLMLPRGGVSPIPNGAEIRIGLETFKFTY